MSFKGFGPNLFQENCWRADVRGYHETEWRAPPVRFTPLISLLIALVQAGGR